MDAGVRPRRTLPRPACASRRPDSDRRRGRRRPFGAADPGPARMKIEEGIRLSRFTTLGTGGPASAFARPETIADLRTALGFAGEHGLAVATIGLGSNLLVAGGGAPNAVSLHRARAGGLGGFEFACAIPGTAGGGVWMNAGAYGGDWARILERALVVDAGGARWQSREELGL